MAWYREAVKFATISYSERTAKKICIIVHYNQMHFMPQNGGHGTMRLSWIRPWDSEANASTPVQKLVRYVSSSAMR